MHCALCAHGCAMHAQGRRICVMLLMLTTAPPPLALTAPLPRPATPISLQQQQHAVHPVLHQQHLLQGGLPGQQDQVSSALACLHSCATSSCIWCHGRLCMTTCACLLISISTRTCICCCRLLTCCHTLSCEHIARTACISHAHTLSCRHIARTACISHAIVQTIFTFAAPLLAPALSLSRNATHSGANFATDGVVFDWAAGDHTTKSGKKYKEHVPKGEVATFGGIRLHSAQYF
jgi:hypothetical protein